MTVRAVTGAMLSAPNIVLGIPFDVVGDDEIEPAILVVVEPTGTGGPPTLIRDSSLGRYVSKSSTSIVVVKNGTAVTGHIHIRKSVIVEIPDCHALSIVAFTTYARFCGDISKSSIAIVVIKRAAQRLGRLVDVGGRRLHEEQIHQAILIVVQPGHARAHCLEIVLLVRLRRVLLERDACGFATIGVANWNARLGRYCGAASRGCTRPPRSSDRAVRRV